MKKLKGFSCFSGIGGFDLPMQELGIELVGHSDIDKFSDQTYSKNFPGIKNFGDISKISIEEMPDFDILTGGFPCQDVSVAGKQDLSNGRTVLVEYLLRMLEIKKPKYFIFENVKGLTSIKFKTFFDSICERISEAGYSFKFQVLNTKNFGIPQNRDRIFFVGKLGNEIDFKFPEGKKLEISLADILEKEIDQKYYLTDEQCKKLLDKTQIDIGQAKESCCIDVYNKKIKQDGCSITLTEPHHNNLIILQLNNPTHSNNRVYGSEGISPTLNTMQGGNRQPKIFERPHGYQPYKEYEGNAPTIRANVQGNTLVNEIGRIRKLTPIECERLQGFPDNWTAGVSDSQRYKQLGNAVSVPVVKAVLSNLIFSDIENVEPLDL